MFGHVCLAAPRGSPLNSLHLVLCKRPARFRQLLEQRCGFPPESLRFVKFTNAVVHLLESDRVGVHHRPTAKRGESVTVDIDKVDIDGPQCDSLLQNLRTFIDQCVNHSIDNLRVADFTAFDSGIDGGRFDQLLDIWIDRRIASLVGVPARAGLSAGTSP